MRSSITLSLVALALLFGFAGCSDDDKVTNNNNGGTTVLLFVGTVNGDNGGLSGSIELSINGTTVTGTFVIVAPSSATHALTGTYNTSTKEVTASGGGYTFDGVYDGSNHLEGTMSGSGSGIFVAAKDENNSAVAFCGTFAGTDDGVWNFTIDGTSVTGSYTTSSGTVGALEGTISGNTITLMAAGTSTQLATGTRSGDNASGTWDAGGGNSGTWTGAKCN